LIIVPPTGAVLPQEVVQGVEKRPHTDVRLFELLLQLADETLQPRPFLSRDRPTALSEYLAQEAHVAIDAHRPCHLTQNPLHGSFIRVETELAGHAILQVMSLVHDEITIVGQDPIFHRYVREEKRVIHNDEMRTLC
jgi:hypothetical protein